VRALEVLELTGEAVSGTLPGAPVPWRNSAIVRLEIPRPELVQRLDSRVESMWRSGLVAEAEGLSALGLQPGTTAGKAIGYAQALAQLAGELSELDAIEQTQSLTRRYARRQVGWFRRYDTALTVDARNPGSAELAVAQTLS
jgi:tRNA dimethylallyltransferase